MEITRKGILLLVILTSMTACQFTSINVSNEVAEKTKPPSTVSSIATEAVIEPTSTTTTSPIILPSDTPTITPIPSVVFSVIGDYGIGNENERAVAELVASWNPDFVITTGDNNYPLGGYDTIDENIGQYFHQFIANYNGDFGSGSTEVNRFFPSMGNHDWFTDDAKPYLDYFDLPGNERYYQFSWQFIDFFILDSFWTEPDGVLSDSIQVNWLNEQLSQSSADWKIVYFHHAPYTSGYHLSSTWMRWPFDEWGADLVLSGHSHVYERLEVSGLTYIVNGLGGGSKYDFIDILPESLVRYNQEFGAMRVEVSPSQINGIFMNTAGEIIDKFTIEHSP